MLGEQDLLSLLFFSDKMSWAAKRWNIGSDREKARNKISNLIASGGTRLFDSISAAYTYMQENPQPDRISAIVVLTDGADTDSSMNFNQLLAKLRADSEKGGIRVFTIGYGSGANKDQLKKIADETRAKFFDGTPENIREVFKEISTFF